MNPDNHAPQKQVPQAQGNAPGLGLSSIELGARRGVGPLSSLAARSWHGESRPCVSCGQLVRRTALSCDQCGQDLSPEMLTRMARNSGPWYVHEHVRPFPGVSLERLIKQAERGVLTPITIVRGPSTRHQWRYAAETPQLSKFLGLCWKCQAAVTPDDSRCSSCMTLLDGEEDPLLPSLQSDSSLSATAPEKQLSSGQEPENLKRISQAARDANPTTNPDERSTIGGISVVWPVLGLIIILLSLLLAIIHIRQEPQAPEKSEAAQKTEIPADKPDQSSS